MPYPTPDPRNFLLGKGKCYFDRFDTVGARTGLRHLGNCTAVAVQTEDERIEKRSSMDKTAGVLAEDSKSRKVTIKITADEHEAHNMALFLMGEVGSYTQVGGAIVDEPINDLVLGRVYKLANRVISTVSMTKGATPLVAGTDFVVEDAEAGLVRFLPAAANVTTGDDVLVDYTAGAITAPAGRTTVRGGTQGKIEGAFFYLPDNTRGPNFELEAWRVSAAPDGELGLITEEYGSFSLVLTVLNDAASHPTEPYYRLTERPAA